MKNLTKQLNIASKLSGLTTLRFVRRLLQRYIFRRVVCFLKN